MAYHCERRKLQNALVLNAPIIWTKHASDRSKERDIPKFEAEKVIKAGAIVGIDIEPSGERWRISGHDSDGRQIEVVIALVELPAVYVITVIE